MWRALAMKILAGGAFGYAVLIGTLYFAQERLLFQNDRIEIAPETDVFQVRRIDTPDGETLIAWYTAPQPGCPIFLHLHGNGTHIAIDKWRYQRIVDKGAGLLALAYRGYAGSTGNPTEKGMHIDARAGWDFLIAEGIAPQDVIIHGHSLGAAMSVRLASQVDERLVILEAPFYSMEDLVQKKFPIVPADLLLKHDFTSNEVIADIGSPVLMAHGTQDRLIPMSQSQRLFELAAEPKQYHVFEGSDHNTLVRDGLFDKVWPFVAEHWQPSYPANTSSACLLASSS